jgi:phosphatidylserine synthase 2
MLEYLLVPVSVYSIYNTLKHSVSPIALLVSSYVLILTYAILFMSRASILAFGHSFIGGLGSPMEEKDYGDVCTIYDPVNHPSDPYYNVKDRLDVFVLAHSIGWFIKSMILRDLHVAWICSILFEVIEISFSHLLPNFSECWWDSVIMDVFGCNLIGIHLGYWMVGELGWERFDFYLHAKNKNSDAKFTFSAILLVILISMIDLNFFFVKYIFFVPTTHSVCVVRTLLWIGVSFPGAIELYNWSSSTSMGFKKNCPMILIGSVGLGLEMILAVSKSDGVFNRSTPLVTYLLVVSVVYLVSWSFAGLWKPRRAKKNSSRIYTEH